MHEEKYEFQSQNLFHACMFKSMNAFFSVFFSTKTSSPVRTNCTTDKHLQIRFFKRPGTDNKKEMVIDTWFN